jgi:hypothetical protein
MEQSAVLIARREGQATGEGPLAGAAVTEYGMHDIAPGVGGTGGLATLSGRARCIFAPFRPPTGASSCRARWRGGAEQPPGTAPPGRVPGAGCAIGRPP